MTSAADRRHLSRVASLGCVVCRQLGVDPEIELLEQVGRELGLSDGG